MKKKRIYLVHVGIVFVFSLLLSSIVSAQSYGSDVNKQLADVRKATVKYQNYEKALEDGYVMDAFCVPNMGVHFLNFALLEDGGELDPLTPEILVYEPMKNGKYKLVAVEYMTVGGEVPSLFGQEFENGPFPDSYALHAWVWEGNPNGVFEAHNPNVRACGK